MDEGVLTDDAMPPNPFAGLAGSAMWFDVTDTAAPMIETYSPLRGATDVSATTNVTLVFNEEVMAGRGLLLPTGLLACGVVEQGGLVEVLFR